MSFTWRHWADWTGPYKDMPPTGEKMELTGSAVAHVTEDLKIINFKVYYDPNPFMAKLIGFKLDSQNSGGGCPFQAEKKE